MMIKEVLIYFIYCNIFQSVVAQRKAKQKCNEYVNHHMQPPLIMEGMMASQNEFPHMAALGYGSIRNPEWLCGGTLISNQFVLTAAHCTNVRNLGPVQIVHLGTRNLEHRGGTFHQHIRVEHIIRSPSFKFPTAYNDIALLRLQRKVQFSKNILPACLNTAFNVNLATNTLIALSWWRMDFGGPGSDDLLEVPLRLSHPRDCNSEYNDKLPYGIREETQICASGDFQRDICQGDSGGPLEYKNGRFHYIIGVTSYAKDCGVSRYPGVYTRVSAFVPWIESIVWP